MARRPAPDRAGRRPRSSEQRAQPPRPEGRERQHRGGAPRQRAIGPPCERVGQQRRGLQRPAAADGGGVQRSPDQPRRIVGGQDERRHPRPPGYGVCGVVLGQAGPAELRVDDVEPVRGRHHAAGEPAQVGKRRARGGCERLDLHAIGPHRLAIALRVVRDAGPGFGVRAEVQDAHAAILDVEPPAALAYSRAVSGPVYDSAAPPPTFLGGARAAWRSRSLLRVLVARDLAVRYKRSVLGVWWTLLNPLLEMAVFWVVFSQVFRFAIPGIPYSLYCPVGAGRVHLVSPDGDRLRGGDAQPRRPAAQSAGRARRVLPVDCRRQPRDVLRHVDPARARDGDRGRRAQPRGGAGRAAGGRARGDGLRARVGPLAAGGALSGRGRPAGDRADACRVPGPASIPPRWSPISTRSSRSSTPFITS